MERSNQSQGGLLPGETNLKDENSICHVIEGEAVSRITLEAGATDQNKGHISDMSIPSQLVFDLNTSTFYKQAEDGALVPVSNLNVSVVCDGKPTDRQS